MISTFSTLRRHSTAALLTAVGTFTAIAVFDLAAHPADQGALRTYKEYVLTATILPAVAVVLWALSALQQLQSGQDSRSRRVGLRIAVIGLLGLVVDAIVTMASGSTDTAGPLYPVAMLASLIGIVLIAIQWYRAGALPRWTGPTLAAGWFLGATPILGTGGAFLILAAAFLAIAVGIRRQTAARVTAPVSVESSVTA
jgi:hypothetical protein